MQSCASDPLDDGSSNEFDFPIETDGTIDAFATVGITVMKDGTLTIVEASVADYKMDSNGDWIGL